MNIMKKQKGPKLSLPPAISFKSSALSPTSSGPDYFFSTKASTTILPSPSTNLQSQTMKGPYYFPASPKSRTNINMHSISQETHDSANSPSLPQIMHTDPTPMARFGKSLPGLKIPFAQLTPGLLSPTTIPVSTRRDSEYVKQEGYLKKNPHINKFHKDLGVLSLSSRRRSPLSKEVFYYPDQVEMNEEFAHKKMEMKKKEDNSLYQLKNLREGKKEQIDLMIGSKCYLRIRSWEKKFPLTIKFQTYLGLYEIYVSKSIKNPNKQNCDFSFNCSSFEINYPSNSEIEYIYLTVNGLGKLKATIMGTFASFQTEKLAAVQKTLALHKLKSNNKKELNLTARYEFFKEHMTFDEEKEFQEIIDEIKKEKKDRVDRDKMDRNADEAGMSRKERDQQLNHAVFKREMKFIKIKENKEKLDFQRQQKRAFNLIKFDLKKTENERLQQMKKEIKQRKILQMSWLTLATLIQLCKSIYDKKIAINYVKIIQNIKNSSAEKIQTSFREYLYRPLDIKLQLNHMHQSPSRRAVQMKVLHQPGEQEEDENIFTHKNARVGMEMFKALNSIALLSRRAKTYRAERIMNNLFMNLKLPFELISAINPYIQKVIWVQKQWKNQIKKITARIQIFRMCWDEYCAKMLEDPRTKKKLQTIISLMKREQIVKYARTFVLSKMDACFKSAQAFRLIVQQYKMTVLETAKQAQIQTPQTKSSVNTPDGKIIRRERLTSKKLFLDKQKLMAIEKKEETALEVAVSNSKFKPTNEEFKSIFDVLTKEVEQSLAIGL